MKNSLVLVDSSYFIRGVMESRDPLRQLKQREEDYSFAINGTIWIEVLRGRSDPRIRDRFEAAFSVTRMLTLSPAGWQRAARLAWQLDRTGETIPLPDIVIGMTALEHGAIVLTFDKHYQRIPGLKAVSDLE